MPPLGTFAFVLHTHLPYSRNAGRWPHGEEWLYEAASETYIPLAEMLLSLPADLRASVTMSMTPVLVEQLASSAVLSGAHEYINDRAERATSDISRFEKQGDVGMAGLASYYRDWYLARGAALSRTLSDSLVTPFRDLQAAGRAEIITSGATHAFLPLLSRDSSVYSQVKTGVESYRSHFGSDPAGFWLPECAYRPATVDAAGTRRPGLEAFLEGQGLRFFFVESHAVTGGTVPDPSDLPGFYRLGQTTPPGQRPIGGPAGSYVTARPYYVGNSSVAAIARNQRLSQQVWSADYGYPGDRHYREFHRKDDVSGLQYWAITGPGVDLGSKQPYDPSAAAARVSDHARHFAARVVEELAQQNQQHGPGALVTAVFDTELFGHWWFEGVQWLRQVLLLLGEDQRIRIMPVREHLDQFPPDAAVDLPVSTWGAGGDDRTWRNDLTQDLWDTLHRLEPWVEDLATRYSPDRQEWFLQAAREFMLAASSDWPFLITTGQAASYGRRRFESHVERFELLRRMILADTVSPHGRDYLQQTMTKDELFPDLQPEWFTARQGCAT